LATSSSFSLSATMSVKDYDHEEKHASPGARSSPDGFADEKPGFNHIEGLQGVTHETAERGHVATDKSVSLSI